MLLLPHKINSSLRPIKALLLNNVAYNERGGRLQSSTFPEGVKIYWMSICEWTFDILLAYLNANLPAFKQFTVFTAGRWEKARGSIR